MILIWKVISFSVLPVFVLLFGLRSLVTGSKRRGFWHHLGFVPKIKNDPRFAKTLWFFALSVGEVGSIVPVLKKIREQTPEIRIVVSVTTDAGYDAAIKNLSFIEEIFFNPIDLWPIPVIAAKRIHPDIFTVTETGFWPGQLGATKSLGAKNILIQGRISDRGFDRYRKTGRLAQKILNLFDYLGMQSQDGVDKTIALGLAPEKIKIIGNTKFDGLCNLDKNARKTLRKRLNLSEEIPVWVAGSLHEGEEEIILDVFQRLKQHSKMLTLILAPRHLGRLGNIESLLNSRKISYIKRTKISPKKNLNACVILLNTIGELTDLYAIAKAAFVGKSLIPPGGGHSLLEPLAQGTPTLHGPYIEYQKHTVESIKDEGALFQVNDAGEMEDVLKSILFHNDIGIHAAKSGPDWITSRQGSSEKIAEVILKIL
tara:strand:+ start:792 stop:2072 length:1281 start_codon:yes stop_codon:yes gene_type:complete